MGCELEFLPGKSNTEHTLLSNSSWTEHGPVTVYDRLGTCTATNKSDHILTQQRDCKMASADDKSGLNNDQNLAHRSHREPVESIDSTILAVADDKTEVLLNTEKVKERTERVPRETQQQSEMQSPSSLRDDSARCRQNSNDEQCVSTEIYARNKPNVTNEPVVHNELNVSNKQTVSIETNVSDGPNANNEPNSSNGAISCENIQAETLKKLEILKDRLKTCTDIPAILHDVSLNCLKPSTIDYMSYHLDPESDVLSADDKCKDYRGMAEWIGLENVFIKYISRSSHLLKTREVLSKWLTLEEEPVPNLKNLRECLLYIDRPDVLEDMSIKIAFDAVSWKRTEIEAKTKRDSVPVDTSWQLTRHDVVTGKETYYTCCLVYADEDEGMAHVFTKLYKGVYPVASFFLPQFDLKQGSFIYETTAQVIEERCAGKVIFLISEYFFASNVCRFAVNFCKEMESLVSGKKTMYTACLLYADEDELMAQLIIKLYKTAYRGALFFLPQFDLKHGKYILDTTAKVIDERCDKKVVFLLSEYFYASTICQFAVNYAAAHGTGHGNLIPFHLTRNVTSVPNVLKGIAGIRWFRKGTREHTWDILTDSLLGEKMEDKALLVEIKERILKMVEKDREYYLQDPPYDDDVEPPGEPIEVIEPEGATSMPPSLDFEFQRMKLEEEIQRKQEKKTKWKFLKQLKRAIFEKVLPRPLKPHCIPSSSSPSSSPSGTPMRTFKVTERPVEVSGSSKGISSSPKEQTKADDSELGAVGGVDADASLQCCNDLNAVTEADRKDKSLVNLNISRSESKSSIISSGNGMAGSCTSLNAQRCQNGNNGNHTNCGGQASTKTNGGQASTRTKRGQASDPADQLILYNRETYRSNISETLKDKDMNEGIASEKQAFISEEKDQEGDCSNIAGKDEADETDALMPDSTA